MVEAAFFTKGTVLLRYSGFTFTAVVFSALISVIPIDAYSETSVFTFDSFEWSGGQLAPAECDLWFVLPQDAERVEDVRVSFAGVSDDGSGICCGAPGGGCDSFSCSAVLRSFFVANDSVQSQASLPGEGVEHTGFFDFQLYECDPRFWHECPGSPVGPNVWSFLASGENVLRLVDVDVTWCETKCSARFDLTSIEIEVDYSISVPNKIEAWGSIKARYGFNNQNQ